MSELKSMNGIYWSPQQNEPLWDKRRINDINHTLLFQNFLQLYLVFFQAVVCLYATLKMLTDFFLEPFIYQFQLLFLLCRYRTFIVARTFWKINAISITWALAQIKILVQFFSGKLPFKGLRITQGLLIFSTANNDWTKGQWQCCDYSCDCN